MATANELPQSGYLLEHLYANDLHLSVKRPEENTSSADHIVFGWDWEVVDSSSFEVRLKLGFDPTPERFEEVRLTLSGRFRISAETPSVDFQDFVKLHAVAILIPYARELLASLTARGFYGAVTLPALNVVQLMQNTDPSQATGAQQLAHGEARLGLIASKSEVPSNADTAAPNVPSKAKRRGAKGRARKSPTGAP